MTAETVAAHGARIPTIGFGTWPLRGEACVAAVAAAIEAGYRHIDTAAGYDNEAEVGEAIRACGVPRDDLFITTKVTPWELGDGDLQRSAERSLSRLGIDALDLLLIHWPSRTLPVAATIRPLNDARRRGLTRQIGVSNFTTQLLAEAWAATEEPLAVLQCDYHPRLNQDKLLAACRARGMAFVAYSPLGQGDALSEPAICKVADRLSRTPAQVVLRWLIQQQGVVAIPKSANRQRIADNRRVFDFTLVEGDMAAIKALATNDGRIVREPSLAPD